MAPALGSQASRLNVDDVIAEFLHLFLHWKTLVHRSSSINDPGIPLQIVMKWPHLYDVSSRTSSGCPFLHFARPFSNSLLLSPRGTSQNVTPGGWSNELLVRDNGEEHSRRTKCLYLPIPGFVVKEELDDGARYSVINGGKRIGLGTTHHLGVGQASLLM